MPALFVISIFKNVEGIEKDSPYFLHFLPEHSGYTVGLAC